jgi:hypothetical protein
MLPRLNGMPLSITNAVFAREIHPQGNSARGLVAICGVKPQKPEGEQKPADPNDQEQGGNQGGSQQSGGCGSTVSGGAVMAIVLAIGLAIPFGKKKKD